MAKQKNSGMYVTTARARKAVAEFLELTASPETRIEDVGRVTNQLDNLGLEVVPALVEAMEHEHPGARVMAAWMLNSIACERPSAIADRQLLGRIVQELHRTLTTGDVSERYLGCILLGLGGHVPKQIVSVLCRMLEGSDKKLGILAATALTSCGDRAILALPVLGGALSHVNDMVAAIAASALVRLGVRKEAVQYLVAALGKVHPASQYSILKSLEQIGPSANSSVAALQSFLENSSHAPWLRGAAAKSLGSVTRGTSTGRRVLMKSLNSTEWQVIQGAIEGCELAGRFPDQAAARFVQLLSATDENMRGTAAIGLRAMGTDAEETLPALIERASKECNRKVGEAMILAIAAVASKAIPPLIDALKQDDIHRNEVAAAALAVIGGDAARAVAELLRAESDSELRLRAFAVLRHMGHRAAAAAPILGDALDEIDDDELAAYCLAILFACGSSAKPALPAVLRCLLNRSTEISEWAARILWNMGPEAVPLMSAELDSAQGEAKDRLERALNWTRGVDETRFARFERLNRDSLVEMFVLVAGVLLKDAPLSWSNTIKKLTEQLGKEGMKNLPFRTSTSSLRLNMSDLEKLLGVKLTTHRLGRRGGHLTSEGKELLPEATDYLASKRRRAGPSLDSA